MRILYMLFTMLFISNQLLAQRNFQKSQWHEWDQAAQLLDKGDFNQAIGIYKLYPNDAGFKERLRQAQMLRQQFLDAQELQKSGRYAEAIAAYKKHRTVEGLGSLTAFERKIDECIAKLGNPNNSRLKDLERQVLAVEFSYKGQRKINQGNSKGALDDFIRARQMGAGLSISTKQQIQNWLDATNQFIVWEKKYLSAQKNIANGKEERNLLLEYGNIPLVKIPSLNRRLTTLTEQLEGKNAISESVRNCDIERLVENLAANTSATSDVLYKRNEFKSIYTKIDELKNDPRNDSTLLSAYQSLSTMTTFFPEDVQLTLKKCVDEKRAETFRLFADKARAKGDVGSEKRYEAIVLNKTIVEVTCVKMEEFTLDVLNFNKSLSECRLEDARQILEKLERSADCDEKRIVLRENKASQILLIRMIAEERRFTKLSTDAKVLLINGNYEESKDKYLEMSKANICDKIKRDRDVSDGLKKIKSLEGTSGFKIELTGSLGTNKPLYRVNNETRSMSYGLTGTAGVQFAYVNSKSPADLIVGIDYLNTSYYSLDSDGYAIENFKISGVSGSLTIKIHPIKPWKVRPYIKVGAETTMPLAYSYENYSSSYKMSDTNQLNKFLPSAQGGVGLDIQIKKFGCFVEAFANYGIKGIYDRSQRNASATPNQEVNARFRRAGVKIGVRLF